MKAGDIYYIKDQWREGTIKVIRRHGGDEWEIEWLDGPERGRHVVATEKEIGMNGRKKT